MTDNSPEYFANLERILAHTLLNTENLKPETLYLYKSYIVQRINESIHALRAAAVLARENAELRGQIAAARRTIKWYGEEQKEYMQRAESAESANRALQAEVDRLRAILAFHKIPHPAGTEPQEGT